MIRCDEIPDRASDWIDSAGRRRDRLALALHLAICSDCRGYVRGLKQTRRLVAATLRRPAEPATYQRLGLSSAEDEEPRP